VVAFFIFALTRQGIAPQYRTVLSYLRGNIIELNRPSGPQAWRRRGWLALVGGAHLLAFLYWQAPERSLAALAMAHQPITYILAPVRRPPPEPPKIARKAPERILPRQAPNLPVSPLPLPPPTPEAVTQPQAITQAAPPPDPFALPVKPEEDLKQRALKSAFAADKQVRKESWTQRDRKIVNDTTALAAAFDKAYVGGGSGAIGEVTMADGTRVTKWRMPGGAVVCISKQGNGPGGDPFRDTGRTKITSCP
jgi:hypothetical protein